MKVGKNQRKFSHIDRTWTDYCTTILIKQLKTRTLSNKRKRRARLG